MGDGVDEIARSRLDRVEADLLELRGDAKAIVTQITAIDLRSAERHGVSQTQNAAIIAQLAAVDKRLNEPSALISLLGNKAAIAGAVTLLGALTTLALALGYGGAKASEVVETPAALESSTPAPPEHDVAP